MTYRIFFLFLFLQTYNIHAQVAAYIADCDYLEYDDLREKCTQDEIDAFIFQYLGEKDAFNSDDTIITVRLDLMVDEIGNLQLEHLELLQGNEIQAAFIHSAIDTFTADKLLIPATDSDGEFVKEQKSYTYTFIGYPNAERKVGWYREIFKAIEQMPRFPGCEDIEGSDRDKKQCADKKMLEFIYSNLEYPPVALANQNAGTVVVQFIVDRDGSIKNIKINRDVGGGTGEEAAYIIYMMSQMEERWTPGRQRGRLVRTQFVLPVKFQL